MAADASFTSDAGSELGADMRDLGDNGTRRAGNHFAASGFIGEQRFTFSGLSAAARAFVNHFAIDALSGWAVVVSAYGDNNQIMETRMMTVDTTFDSYNEGSFLAIPSGQAHIRSSSVKGVRVMMDNFTYTTPVPQPESDARMLTGLASLGLLARRRA